MAIQVSTDNLDFFQCFSSEKKIRIIELMAAGPKTIGELATALEVSSTIVTRHVNAMEEAGIVNSEMLPAKRGKKRVCALALERIDLRFSEPTEADITTLSIPVGQFTAHKVEPTCGMASQKSYIGMVDDPRYFSSPVRDRAEILWFQSGHVTYTLPGYLFERPDAIESLNISFEICSEFPGYRNDYPSDIHFYLNDVYLGYWTSPGNFGDKKGMVTPGWFTCGTEYGLLKNLIVTGEGTFIDGVRLSDITLEQLSLDSKTNQNLRISSPQNTEHPGGVTLFGKSFGNYEQDIVVRIQHS